MEAVEALAALGGAAGGRNLLRLTTARKLRTAINSRRIIRIGRGRFRLPDADRALAKAIEIGGMVSHLSAAQLHGWELPFSPTLPWVSVPRNSRARGVRGCQLKWAELSEEGGHVTSPLRAVIDSGRVLPFPAALAVADSALRHGDVDAETLAPNPFESVVRGIAIEAGLAVAPQSPIPLGSITVHPDLVDRGRRLVIEAESWSGTAARRRSNVTAGATRCWWWMDG